MPKTKSYENTAKTVIKALEKRGMEGFYFESSKDAVAKIMEMLPEEAVVSWGGSMTLSETGMMDALRKSGLTLVDRMTANSPEEARELYSKTVLSDYYFMSTNAITLDGELVNIDGNGNRVACLITGPSNVMILAGMNKLVSDIETGCKRVRNFAAPPNAVRLNVKTPCAVLGKCEDCLSPDCMCCEIVITRKSRKKNRIKVFLIGEELGY